MREVTVSTKSETVVERLQAIRAVVAHGWTQGAGARDIKGRGVPCLDPDAVCWCLAGASARAWENSGRPRYLGSLDLTRYLGKDSGFHNYVHWNDAPGRTQEQVLAFLDKAIKIEQAYECSEAR